MRVIIMVYLPPILYGTPYVCNGVAILLYHRNHSTEPADHQFLRVNMCALATERASQWLMADPWEAFQSYQRTAVVLDHFDYEINTVLGGAQLPSSDERRHIRVVLLAGSDLISTMSEPGVWSEEDVSDIPP